MKKSFKKAGAAVLSMAMLLSMGAISMPVYADNPDNWPGQVEVTINTNTWADKTWTPAEPSGAEEKTREFEYVQNVKDATVTMYKVAELGTDGWKWTDDFKSAVNRQYHDNAAKLLNDFEKLLATETGTDDKEYFTATSAELLEVASALERVTRDVNGDPQANTTIPYISQKQLHLDDNGTGSVFLPGDDELDRTKDRTGYYLITTTSSDAGVVLQPVLITLKNSKTKENPQVISLKGYEINVDKSIEKVVDKDVNKSLGGVVKSNSGNTAVVAKDDVITYKIETQVPKYDVNIDGTNQTAMKNFVIKDTPSAGLTVTETVSDGNGGSATVVKGLKVVATPEGGEAKELTKDTDYTVNIQNGYFEIVFTPTQYHTTSGNTTNSKLEGQTITVTFDATVNENFKTENNKTATYANVTKALMDAESTASTVATNGKKYADGLAKFNSSTPSTDAQKEAVIKLFDTSFDSDDNNTISATFAALTEEQKAAAGMALIAVQTGESNGSKTWTDITTIGDNLTNATAWKAAYDVYKVAIDGANGGVAIDNTDILKVINDAGAAAAAAADPATTYTDITELTDEQRVQAYLALEKLKTSAVGNDNTAGITYGNEYATGKGAGNDEDKVTVYSVDLDLTKITTNLILNDNGGDDKDKRFTVGDSTTAPVAGAIFELIKVDNGGGSATSNKSLGWAISDENGKLHMLDETFVPDATPTPATGEALVDGQIGTAPATYKYKVDDVTRTLKTVKSSDQSAGEGLSVKGTVYYTEVTSNPEDAWQKLTIGDYQLVERKAPAGYKQIKDPITFNITANKSGSGDAAEYDGSYDATATNDADGKIIPKDSTTGKQFNYNGPSGALEADVINPKDDLLPATGGIGTVLFTAGGISIVLIAGALFVMYMKKRNAEDEE